MPYDYRARIARLLERTPSPTVAVVPGSSMTYFTGVNMYLSERPTIALLSESRLAVIVPELEVPVWASLPDLPFEIFRWRDADGYAGAFAQAVNALGLDSAPLGVDGGTMRVFEYLALSAAGAGDLRDVGGDLLDVRAIKTADEIDAMRRAIQISEAALERLVAWVQPGMTERQIAAELDRLLAEMGAQGYAFPALVQTGENSAIPHGHVSDRPLRSGEFLLIDFGGRWAGYPADITRTFCTGTPSDEMTRIYETVLAANRAAVAACRPGIQTGALDRIARDVIENAGYGAYFVHRTGHGLGLDIHELPNITSGDETVLQPGMVFTIEPGIYVPGLGGVRIEDNVCVTADGADVLTSYPRHLVIG